MFELLLRHVLSEINVFVGCMIIIICRLWRFLFGFTCGLWHQYVHTPILSHRATILCVHFALYGTHWSRALECTLSRCDFSAGPYPALRCFILINLLATVGFYNCFGMFRSIVTAMPGSVVSRSCCHSWFHLPQLAFNLMLVCFVQLLLPFMTVVRTVISGSCCHSWFLWAS